MNIASTTASFVDAEVDPSALPGFVLSEEDVAGRGRGRGRGRGGADIEVKVTEKVKSYCMSSRLGPAVRVSSSVGMFDA